MGAREGVHLAGVESHGSSPIHSPGTIVAHDLKKGMDDDVLEDSIQFCSTLVAKGRYVADRKSFLLM